MILLKYLFVADWAMVGVVVLVGSDRGDEACEVKCVERMTWEAYYIFVSH